MSHFDISEWTDLARGVLPDERRAALDGHLAEGCPECASAYAILRKAASVAAADRAWNVPPALVTAAEAIFAEQQRVRPPLLSRIFARLIYDNIGELQPLGARAGHGASRQVAFDAGDYYLDLSVGGEGVQVSLLGQFVSRKTPSVPLEGIPVLLVSEDSVIARTMTNQFGEFSLEYRSRKNLRLCLPVAAEGAQIEVPLEELL
jgi:hypothetical protein